MRRETAAVCCLCLLAVVGCRGTAQPDYRPEPQTSAWRGQNAPAALAPAVPPSPPLAQASYQEPTTGQAPESLPPAPKPPEKLPEPRSLPGEADPADEPSASGRANGKELTLAMVIDMTLAANPDLQTASARAQLAEATIARARADFFPLLGLNENYQASNNLFRRFGFILSQEYSLRDHALLLLHTPQVLDQFQSELHLQQDIYTGGLRMANLHAAQADQQASRFALAAVQNRIVFAAAEAYYRLFQTGVLVGVRREAVAQVESQLRAVQARVRAQTATRSDQLQVELRLAEVREALITARNAEELSWAVLENSTGVRLAEYRMPAALPPAPWDDHSRTAESAVARYLPGHAGADEAGGTNGSEVDSAIADALANRPEVAQGQSQKQAAEHRVRAAKSGKYPTLGAVADYDHFTGSIGMTDTFFVGLAASLNLFDGRRTRSSVEQAKARVREAAANNRRIQLDIELDVRRAYLSLKDARERLRVTDTAVRDAEENLRQAQSRFETQTATVTELLDAQLAVSDTRVRQVRSQAEVEIARAELERAIGRFTRFLAPACGQP
jgi:outer membrane protein